MRFPPLVATILVILRLSMPGKAEPVEIRAADLDAALKWFNSLGYPDVTDCPYVRVATGRWSQTANQPPENGFAQGFLIADASDSFTVFICGIPDFTQHFRSLAEPFELLTTVHLISKPDGPIHQRVGYELMDFEKVAAEALERVRAQAREVMGLRWHRAEIFAFARVCAQKGIASIATQLFDIAATIPDEQTGKVSPEALREQLQREIGDAVLKQAESDFGNPNVSLPELLSSYADFEGHFPSHPRVAYARESAELLRTMMAEEAAHQAKSATEMSDAEDIAECIYQLRNLGVVRWIMNSHYPISSRRAKDEEEVVTPVHRLVDLAPDSIPALIEALDDRRFSRCMEMHLNMLSPPRVLRVGDVARNILQHLSGRNFYARKTQDGRLINATPREQADAWWKEYQTIGEKQQLIEAAALGDQAAYEAARKLVEKYPDVALPAIEAGVKAATLDPYRSRMIEAAGKLPGNAPVPFLITQLGPGNGLYSQVRAAEALFARGNPEAVPAMIAAWQRVQPHLATNEDDAYDKVGGLITFLAKSGDVRAINALARERPQCPIEVRLAVVQVFLPWPKSAGSSGIGASVHVSGESIAELPAGPAGAAIERLLVSALDDGGARIGLKGHFDEVAYEDPRICDFAALVLSKRWPKKYRFDWPAKPEERNRQIAALRQRYRSR